MTNYIISSLSPSKNYSKYFSLYCKNFFSVYFQIKANSFSIRNFTERGIDSYKFSKMSLFRNKFPHLKVIHKSFKIGEMAKLKRIYYILKCFSNILFHSPIKIFIKMEGLMYSFQICCLLHLFKTFLYILPKKVNLMLQLQLN